VARPPHAAQALVVACVFVSCKADTRYVRALADVVHAAFLALRLDMQGRRQLEAQYYNADGVSRQARWAWHVADGSRTRVWRSLCAAAPCAVC
jgi:hypothetical protein